MWNIVIHHGISLPNKGRDGTREEMLGGGKNCQSADSEGTKQNSYGPHLSDSPKFDKTLPKHDKQFTEVPTDIAIFKNFRSEFLGAPAPYLHLSRHP